METINRLKATVMYIIKERRAFIRPDFVPMQLLLYPNQVRLPNIPRVLRAPRQTTTAGKAGRGSHNPRGVTLARLVCRLSSASFWSPQFSSTVRRASRTLLRSIARSLARWQHKYSPQLHISLFLSLSPRSLVDHCVLLALRSLEGR